MSAYRQAMLSVPPERLEQFSLELKQNIKDNRSKKSKDYHKHSKTKRSDNKHHKKGKSTSSKTNKLKSSSDAKRKSSNEKKSHKRKKKKTSSEHEHLTDDSDMEENGLDLNKELHPLSQYVKDRQSLSDTVFNIVKGAKLAAMLPDILKNMPVDELKQKCFSHLEVMSSKRIIHILTGEAMHSSSGTDSEDEHRAVLQNNEAVAKEEGPKLPPTQTSDENNLQANFIDSTTSSGCEVLSLLAAGSEQNNFQSGKISSLSDSDMKRNDKEVVIESSSAGFEEPASSTSSEDHPEKNQEEPSDIEEEIETVEIVEDVEYSDMVDAMLEERLAPDSQDKTSENSQTIDSKPQTDTGLSQLELLELQLRARAIKSLMNAAQTSSDSL